MDQIEGQRAEFAMTEKREQVLWGFILVCTSLSLVFSALSPFCFYLLLSATALSLLTSLRQWVNWANLDYSEAPSPLDDVTKLIAGIFIVLVGIYFIQLPTLAQMILSTAASGGLALYFFHECLMQSQENLNHRLHEAARESNPEHVSALLRRGADPFAFDNTQNNAFHHAIQNHESAAAVIKLLKERSIQPPPTLKAILPKINDFTGNTPHEKRKILKQWKKCWQGIRGCLYQFTYRNRTTFYKACKALFVLYQPILPRSFNALVDFLRHQIAYPFNWESKNSGGQTPLALIDIIHINPAYKKDMKVALIGTHDPEPHITTISNPIAQTAPSISAPSPEKSPTPSP